MRRIEVTVALAVSILACKDPPPKPLPLDAAGQRMLDPIRLEALALPKLIERLQLRSSFVVADIGAGPGFLTLPIAHAVKDGMVIATDVRADYLAVLEQRAQAENLSNVKTRVVRPDDPGLEPSSVDLAILCQVDHALVDRTAYFRALIPALRPGGRIVLINFARYKDADLEAAKGASLEVVDAWDPSPPFFSLFLAPKAR